MSAHYAPVLALALALGLCGLAQARPLPAWAQGEWVGES